MRGFYNYHRSLMNHWWFDWRPVRWFEIMNEHRTVVSGGFELFPDALILHLLIVEIRFYWR